MVCERGLSPERGGGLGAWRKEQFRRSPKLCSECTQFSLTNLYNQITIRSNMEFAVLRFEKVKTTRVLKARVMHNHREGKIPRHVDRTRTERNEVEGNAIVGLQRLTEGVRMRKNGVLAVEAVVSFSPSKTKEINLLNWKEENLKWFINRFGEDNILESVLHLDEKTPHMHVIFAPRVKGKFNCRAILGGKAKLRELQDSYASAMEPFGLERGRSRKGRGRTHIPTVEYRALQSDRLNDRKTMVSDVQAFLGEDTFVKFLRFIKDKKRRVKKVEELKEIVVEGRPDVVKPKRRIDGEPGMGM